MINLIGCLTVLILSLLISKVESIGSENFDLSWLVNCFIFCKRRNIMTKIIYFVTPTNMVKIESKAAEFIPILGPTLEFTKKAKKVTEITDPVSASSRGIGIIFNYCFGKAGATSTE